MTTLGQSGTGTGLVIPEALDPARMRRETGGRLPSAMAGRGVDAMIPLGNSAVVYATGTSSPLGDAGLSHVERPVAVVLADDEWPHLFLPFREGAAHESEPPADHLHGPVYLEFDEGVSDFARRLADLIPAGAVIAVDECTGAMSRAAKSLFPNGAPADAAAIVSALWDAGVPVAKLMQPHRQTELRQLTFRDFFEEVDDPLNGRAKLSTVPMRFSGGPARFHTHPAPTLGQHNHELLTALGLSPSEIADLQAQGIIAQTLAMRAAT
jgi:CoA-transferase family III/Creatinase/Prolidase N-terminal domain